MFTEGHGTMNAFFFTLLAGLAGYYLYNENKQQNIEKARYNEKHGIPQPESAKRLLDPPKPRQGYSTHINSFHRKGCEHGSLTYTGE